MQTSYDCICFFPLFKLYISNTSKCELENCFSSRGLCFSTHKHKLNSSSFNDVESNEAYQRDKGPMRGNNTISLCFSSHSRKVSQRGPLSSKAGRINTARTFKGTPTNGIMVIIHITKASPWQSLYTDLSINSSPWQ